MASDFPLPAERVLDHLLMAERLRLTAARLRTAAAREQLLRLAALYEELSVCHSAPAAQLPASVPAGTR